MSKLNILKDVLISSKVFHLIYNPEPVRFRPSHACGNVLNYGGFLFVRNEITW